MDRPRNIYKHKVKNINESKKPVKREANGGQDDGVKWNSRIKSYPDIKTNDHNVYHVISTILLLAPHVNKKQIN